jgi:hypothetical protein
MERITAIAEARKIMGPNFLGMEELQSVAQEFPVMAPSSICSIPYTIQELEVYARDYILVLGVDRITPNSPLNLLSLRHRYGVNPDVLEPCFYNQDWYLQEEFAMTTLENKWYLLRKTVLPATRSLLPDEILNRGIHFPSAILCAYTFFFFYFVRKEFLWYHDFIWCSDTDHNGDRIYVGKYNDIDGKNKNGFSIHRHLALRNCYGSINIYV